MSPVIATFRHQLLSGPARILPGGDGVEPGSVGVILDDPAGYVRLEQVALGFEDVLISRVSSTGYKGRLRDDTHFTFVLQHAGRYEVRISGRDYGMSPEGLLAFRRMIARLRCGPARPGFVPRQPCRCRSP